MATKSFTTDFSFSKKSVTNLIEALENDNLPNLVTDLKVTEVNDANSIKQFFSKG